MPISDPERVALQVRGGVGRPFQVGCKIVNHMFTLAPGLSYLDSHFLGLPRIIATAVVRSAGGAALIDPGPSTTLPSLTAQLQAAGVAVGDITAVLLTHIHLDHAGATGTLVARNPRIKVYVHEKGARHMVNPEKLIASATRLWGADMDRLWGPFLPVPQDAIVALSGGETLDVGRRLNVAYTPGHASHHVSYFDPEAGIAFVGDTAGVQVIPTGPPIPPTPPPDIDLDAWRSSLDIIERWRPSTLFLTHFGPAAPAGAHVAALRERLDWIARLGQASLARAGSDEDRERWFSDEIDRELRRVLTADQAAMYQTAGRFDLSWRGLARYLRRSP